MRSCSMPWRTARSTPGDYEFRHELVDIETLNRRAFSGELELTAVSLHAYAYLTDIYALCPCGASMGDRYGPMVVAQAELPLDDLRDKTDRRARHADDGLSGAADVPGARFQARGRPVRPDSRRRRSGRVPGAAGRRRADHSRRATHLRRAQASSCSSTWASGGTKKPACRCRWAPTPSARTSAPT